MSYMLHFGLINRAQGGYTNPAVLTPRVIADLAASGFACYLDSFIEWGEPVQNDDPEGINYGAPVHVLYPTADPIDSRDGVVVVAMMLDSIVPGLEPVDYAVLTDHDDFSQNAKVIGFYA